MSAKRETITVAAGQITARLMNEAPETLAAIDSAITRAAQMRVELLVLPECAYPAYLLGSVTSYRAGDHLSGEEYVRWLRGRAERFGLHIVSGFVEDTPGGLCNAAVLIDDRGREVGRSRKRFLWNADHEWFQAGGEIRAFNTALGRIGMVICAETRVPEIMATLVADGAELIALPTCWINNAREPGEYYNPQVEYLIEARAREFGVPFVCADKAGVELAAVGYVGQSRIVRADGSVAAAAPATGDAVIAARLMCRRPRRVWVSERWKGRLLERSGVEGVGAGVEGSGFRVQEEGGAVCCEVAGSKGGKAEEGGQDARFPEAARRLRVAAMPTVVANARYSGGMGESVFEPLQRRGVELLLVNMAHEAPAEQMAMLARAFDVHAVGFPLRADVFELGPARVGCVAGQWVRSFAASRALALDGAEILMFFDAPQDLPILRARAMENRVFVMGVSDRWAVVIGPDGAVLAQTHEPEPGEVVAEIDLCEAHDKLVAPKTDIFAERRPGLYRF